MFVVTDLCQPFPTDVLFLIDNSRSMGKEYYALQKQFIINVTTNWTIDINHFQVSVVSFANTAKIEVDFDNVNNITDFRKAIPNLKYTGDMSNLHKGLSTAKTILDNRNRRVLFTNVRKYLIVLSDGLTTPPINIQSIDSQSIKTRVIAVGEDISHYFLREITDNIDNVLPFDARKFMIQLRLELIHPMCTGKDTMNVFNLILQNKGVNVEYPPISICSGMEY